MNLWLVKVKHYGGGESIVFTVSDRKVAQKYADVRNEEYQTDTAYVEKYDPAKMTGWMTLEGKEI